MWMTDTVLFISGTELESQGKKREGCMQHKASAQAKKKKRCEAMPIGAGGEKGEWRDKMHATLG